MRNFKGKRVVRKRFREVVDVVLMYSDFVKSVLQK